MSSNFSANQFDSTFSPKRLQNWQAFDSKSKRPSAREGHTSFIVDDRGHLLPGVKRGNVYPEFKGTWALPARIPVNINPTARSTEGLKRLQQWGVCKSLPHPNLYVNVPHQGTRTTDVLQDVGKQVSGDERQDAPSSTEEAQTSSQECYTAAPVAAAQSQS